MLTLFKLKLKLKAQINKGVLKMKKLIILAVLLTLIGCTSSKSITTNEKLYKSCQAVHVGEQRCKQYNRQ
jgi:hypothetical protein